MKIKNWLVLALGVLSLIGTIGMGKITAMPLSSFPADRPIPRIERTPLNQVTQAQPIAELSTSGLEEKAEQLYQTGQFQQAIALLQQLRSNYIAQGDALGQARALRNLAFVYQETGEWSKADQAITSSLNSLQKESSSPESQQLFAQILEVKGLLQLSKGQAEQALDTWKQAASLYQKIGNVTGVTKNQINQAQALQRLGLYRQAIKTLNEVNLTLQQEPDSLLKAKSLQGLGNAWRVTGELEESEKILGQALAIAQKISDAESIGYILLNLGNTVKLQNKSQLALDYYQRAAKASSSLSLQMRAQVNRLRLLVELEQWSEARQLAAEIKENISQLPISRAAINGRINLARSLILMDENGELNPQNASEIAQILATAIQQSQTLGDPRTLAYAFGNLGTLYEDKNQLNDAKEVTEQALVLAQGSKAADIAYRWQWQLGRILKKQGDREAAIAAYSESLNTLKSIRNDLVAISSEAQFSFRDSVEPIYRELVDLLLPPREEVEQSALKQARAVIDSLQLAELDNFFQDACLETEPVQIDQIDPKAAVFSTIILSDRLEVIVAIPGQNLRRYTTFLPQKEIETTLVQARQAIIFPKERFILKNFLVPSQKIYDWLIRPFETELANSGIQTLVFVLDGELRNIPIAALYDGQKYLVQKYSIALAPGLQLVNAKPLEKGQLKVLMAGLSEARQGFVPLPGVQVELDKIATEVSTEKLLNQSFTVANFKTKTQSTSFPVIHLATHGQFSSQVEETFILTWDNRINAKELENLLRTEARQKRPVELLVLSACQTAAGDNRATLGLTGVAVRAGARSTVASLWNVSDEATTLLMTRFYEELANRNLTKAEALRRAEEALLQEADFSHPYFWAAFILVGNWF